MKRITKQDLKEAQVRYFNQNHDLIDSHYDDFDSLSDAINRSIKKPDSLKYVQISNRNTAFYGEWYITDKTITRL